MILQKPENLTSLIGKLRKHGRQQILVVGPQRSGTTIAHRIIAEDMGYTPISEETIKVDNMQMANGLRHREKYFVLQAPGLSHCWNDWKGDAVVFIYRDPEEIYASQRRIKWDWEQYEYKKCLEVAERYGMAAIPENSTLAKQYLWQVMGPYYHIIHGGNRRFILPYNALKDHPLWVSKEKRAHFHPRQTQ